MSSQPTAVVATRIATTQANELRALANAHASTQSRLIAKAITRFLEDQNAMVAPLHE